MEGLPLKTNQTRPLVFTSLYVSIQEVQAGPLDPAPEQVLMPFGVLISKSKRHPNQFLENSVLTGNPKSSIQRQQVSWGSAT